MLARAKEHILSQLMELFIGAEDDHRMTNFQGKTCLVVHSVTSPPNHWPIRQHVEIQRSPNRRPLLIHQPLVL